LPDGYVTIATFSELINAELSRLKIESEDIPVFILDGNASGMNPFQGLAVGVRLQVPKEFAEQATRLLKDGEEPEIVDEMFVEEDEEDDGDYLKRLTSCPNCHSQHIEKQGGFINALSRAFKANHRYDWHCKRCGEIWRAP